MKLLCALTLCCNLVAFETYNDVRWDTRPSIQIDSRSTRKEKRLQVAAVTAATEKWSAVCNLNFDVMVFDTPNVTVKFVKRWAYDPRFLGFASAKTNNGRIVSAVIEINCQHYKWRRGGPLITWKGWKGTANLDAVLLHEFGHVIGINHSDDSGAVMYQYPSGDVLTQDDISAAISLYGVRQ